MSLKNRLVLDSFHLLSENGVRRRDIIVITFSFFAFRHFRPLCINQLAIQRDPIENFLELAPHSFDKPGRAVTTNIRTGFIRLLHVHF
jgi:hypothetical protein